MFTSILILTVSFALLVYWFRYCCLGLLRNRTAGAALVPGNRFSFQQVTERIPTEPNLDPLHQALDRDYRVVTYLLRHAAGFGAQSVEHRILLLDYKLMQVWYFLTRGAAPRQARKALAERAAILGCLAQKMGEQAGLRGEA